MSGEPSRTGRAERVDGQRYSAAVHCGAVPIRHSADDTLDGGAKDAMAETLNQQAARQKKLTEAWKARPYDDIAAGRRTEMPPARRAWWSTDRRSDLESTIARGVFRGVMRAWWVILGVSVLIGVIVGLIYGARLEALRQEQLDAIIRSLR